MQGSKSVLHWQADSSPLAPPWKPGLLVTVQSLSHVQPFVIPWTAAHQASLSFTISWSLLKLMFIESVVPPNGWHTPC